MRKPSRWFSEEYSSDGDTARGYAVVVTPNAQNVREGPKNELERQADAFLEAAGEHVVRPRPGRPREIRRRLKGAWWPIKRARAVDEALSALARTPWK